MPVLDTDFLIALEQQDEAALDLLEELHTRPLLVPGIVAVEFLTSYGDEATAAFHELERAFTLVHTSTAWIAQAARFRDRLGEEGATIRLVDVWIATWAILHDTSVVTRNVRHFQAMGVPVQT